MPRRRFTLVEPEGLADLPREACPQLLGRAGPAMEPGPHGTELYERVGIGCIDSGQAVRDRVLERARSRGSIREAAVPDLNVVHEPGELCHVMLVQPLADRGSLTIERMWKPGDAVLLTDRGDRLLEREAVRDRTLEEQRDDVSHRGAYLLADDDLDALDARVTRTHRAVDRPVIRDRKVADAPQRRPFHLRHGVGPRIERGIAVAVQIHRDRRLRSPIVVRHRAAMVGQAPATPAEPSVPCPGDDVAWPSWYFRPACIGIWHDGAMRHGLWPVARWVPILFLLVAISLEAGTANLTFVAGAANDLLVRKFGHAGVYALLAVLVRWALSPALVGHPRKRSSPGGGVSERWIAAAREWLLPFAFAGLIAILDEVAQAGSPGREPKLTDVATDLTGALLALVLMRSWLIHRIDRGRASRLPLADATVEVLRRRDQRPADGEI